MGIIPSWNIIRENAELIEMINRTNNALELYNRRINALFLSKPSLLVFVQVLQEGARDQEARLQEIQTWQAHPADHLKVTIPEVDPAYPRFKADEDATAAAAATKASSKASRKKATTKN